MQKQRDPLRLIVPRVFDPETTAVLSVPVCQLLPTYQDELLNEPLKEKFIPKRIFCPRLPVLHVAPTLYDFIILHFK